jgi:DNA invertase Pin-like site-specific DNA recombinase
LPALIHQVVAIKEGIRLEGQQDLQTRGMVTLFGLLAEIERESILLRAKKALAAARAAGKRLGRPSGRRGQSKLDGEKADSHRLLGLRVSKASIAKITRVDRSTLYHYCGNPEYTKVS